MSALTVIHEALTSPEARRAQGASDVAHVVAEALWGAGLLIDGVPRCPHVIDHAADEYVRCVEVIGHDQAPDDLHFALVEGVSLSWSGTDSAAMLRERI